jgi:hypothetical protein
VKEKKGEKKEEKKMSRRGVTYKGCKLLWQPGE